ncbi:hypothetical protein NKH99_15305 [Mesorhizobium sp. M0854]|uniref:hypothetical protein n=1 Tax=Mesorhizobium sp. M0854 TaxID=2957013 RepID=UPI003336D5E4
MPNIHSGHCDKADGDGDLTLWELANPAAALRGSFLRVGYRHAGLTQPAAGIFPERIR